MVYFFWRVRGQPGAPHRLHLQNFNSRPTDILEIDHAGWEGEMVELGLDIYGELADEGLTLRRIHFHPRDWRADPEDIVKSWSYFRGWDASSINA